MDEEHGQDFLKLLFKGLIPIVFFIGGIVILVSRMAFWSIFLGLPTFIIGLAMLINAFDEIASSAILPKSNIVTCIVCKKPTPAIPGLPEKDTICAKCREDIAKGGKS